MRLIEPIVGAFSIIEIEKIAPDEGGLGAVHDAARMARIAVREKHSSPNAAVWADFIRAVSVIDKGALVLSRRSGLSAKLAREVASYRACSPSSTSRTSFSCLAKKFDPPTSGCTRFIKRL
jgi:hypothetical protein